MRISVVITCFNEAGNIVPCLESLLAQTYPADKFEVVVADGGSSDQTQELVKSLAELHPQIKLVVEPKPGTAAGRNAGIRAAQYEYIAFIDADCEAPASWLESLAGCYSEYKIREPQLAAVGGGNLPPEDASPFVAAIGIALDSYAGSFNSAQGRQFNQPRFVAGLATLNTLIERSILENLGCFDETLGSEAEDADLNYRLHQAGWKLLFLPGADVWHKMRPTPRGWLKNMFRYGKGRARLLKRYPQMWQLSFILPLVFLLVIVSLPLAAVSKVFWLGWLYFPVLFVFSYFLAHQKGRSELFWQVGLVFLIQHFGYAVGEGYGLLSRSVR